MSEIDVGTQVEVDVPSLGFVVVEVAEVGECLYVGDRVYASGDVWFHEDQIVDVFDY